MEVIKNVCFEENGDEISNEKDYEVSALLDKIQSIDIKAVVVVDDVRDYGPGDIKRLCEEMSTGMEEDEL